MCRCLFNQSHGRILQVLAVTNKTAMNIHEPTLSCLLDKCPGVKWFSHMVFSYVNYTCFLKVCVSSSCILNLDLRTAHLVLLFCCLSACSSRATEYL